MLRMMVDERKILVCNDVWLVWYVLSIVGGITMNKQELSDKMAQLCAELRDDGMINVEHKDGSECRHTPICEVTTLQITAEGKKIEKRGYYA